MRGCLSVRRTRRGFPAGSASTALPTGRERTARAAGRASMPRWRAGRRSCALGSRRWRSRSAGADRGEVTEDFAAYAVELTAVKEGRLPAPEGMAVLREAIARQKGAHLTVTAVPCAALTLDRAETLHGGALELAWGEIAEG